MIRKLLGNVVSLTVIGLGTIASFVYYAQTDGMMPFLGGWGLLMVEMWALSIWLLKRHERNKYQLKRINVPNMVGSPLLGDSQSNVHSQPARILSNSITPPNTTYVIGREADEQKLYTKLEDQNIALLQGEGGIGKTHFASYYFQKYEDNYTHAIWLFAKEGIQNAFLSLSSDLGVSFPRDMQEEDRLKKVFSVLLNLPPKSLLVIDNADDLQELIKIRSIIKGLNRLHIIITSRINELEGYEGYILPLFPFQANTAFALFRKHYPDYETHHIHTEDQLLSQLFRAIEYNTLVVELLAKNLSVLNTNDSHTYPLKQLVKELEERGIFKLSKEGQLHTDYADTHGYSSRTASSSSHTASELLKFMYEISGLSKQEKYVLSAFSVLPAEPIRYRYIEPLLISGEIPEDALSTAFTNLYRKGWLTKSVQDKSIFHKIHPVVQKVFQEKHPSYKEDYKILITGLYTMLTSSHKLLNEDLKNLYIRYSIYVVDCTDGNSAKIGLLCRYLGNYYKSKGQYTLALEYYTIYQEWLEEYIGAYPDDFTEQERLAKLYKFKADLYPRLGDYNQALALYQKSKVLYDTLREEDSYVYKIGEEYIRLCSNMGQVFIYQGKYSKAKTVLSTHQAFMHTLSKEAPENPHYKQGLANAYRELGKIAQEENRTEEALEAYQNALLIVETLYEKDLFNNEDLFQDLIGLYIALGVLYHGLNKVEEAKKYFQKVHSISQEAYDTDLNNIAYKKQLVFSLIYLGGFEREHGSSIEAQTHLEKSLALIEELQQAFPENRYYIQWASTIYINLAGVYESLSQIDTALTYLQKAIQLRQQLYESSPTPMNTHNLALSFDNLGAFYWNYQNNFQLAHDYWKEAETLLLELTQRVPTNAGYKNTLANVHENLDELYSHLPEGHPLKPPHS